MKQLLLPFPDPEQQVLDLLTPDFWDSVTDVQAALRRLEVFTSEQLPFSEFLYPEVRGVTDQVAHLHELLAEVTAAARGGFDAA